MGTDHYGALDNPATLDNPALPTVRASRFIRDPPLPRTYRHPRHWFLVQAFWPSRSQSLRSKTVQSYKSTSFTEHARLHVPSTRRVAPFLIRSTLGPCQLHNQLFWSSLLLLDISCFESDSTSSLYTTSIITFRTKDKLVLTSGAKQQFCRSVFTTKNAQ